MPPSPLMPPLQSPVIPAPGSQLSTVCFHLFWTICINGIIKRVDFYLVPLPQHHVLEFRVHCRRASACFLFRLLQPLCGWTHFVDQTDTQGRSRAPTLWLLWVTLVCRCFCGIVFSVLLAAHPGVALLGQVVTWCNSLTVHNAFRVLPREHTGRSKHPLPTTQEKTLHMDITRWSTPKSD